jgi:cytochrome c-type biogenesis protein
MNVALASPVVKRRQFVSALVALFVLLSAVGLALLADRDARLAIGLLTLSAGSSDTVMRFGGYLPLGFAFTAGMAAAVNPCGFGLLPGYLALYLRDGDATATRSGGARVGRAVTIGVTVTASFIALFGAAGLLLTAAGALIVAALPWLSVAIGGLLIVSGARLLGGSSLYVNVGEPGGARLGRIVQRADVFGYIAYGLGFALSSLGCTLPLFLTVVGTALAAGGLFGGLIQFVLYALGMGAVLTFVAVVTALFGTSIKRARGVGRYVEPASAILLLVSGAYLVYYWLTIGGLLG